MGKYTYTFIIPHKNCPDLLQRCMESIPERDDVQIIVVDDNSDEGKKPQISRKSVEVVLLDAKYSKGAGRARNVGLKHAKGKWLLFADSDDYYNNDFMNVLDSYKDKEIDVLYFNFEYKDGKTGEEMPPLSFQNYYKEYDESKDARDKIVFRIKNPWNKMVSRSYINKYHINFEEVSNGNDILFSMKVGYYANNILVEKTPLYVYLHNMNSILTSKETVEAALCRLIHLIKLNYFYSFIGHPDWNRSIIRRIISKIYSLKGPFVLALCIKSKQLYKERNEWVEIFSKLR